MTHWLWCWKVSLSAESIGYFYHLLTSELCYWHYYHHPKLYAHWLAELMLSETVNLRILEWLGLIIDSFIYLQNRYIWPIDFIIIIQKLSQKCLKNCQKTCYKYCLKNCPEHCPEILFKKLSQTLSQSGPRNWSKKLSQMSKEVSQKLSHKTVPKIVPKIGPKIVNHVVPKIVLEIVPKIVPIIVSKFTWYCPRNYNQPFKTILTLCWR